MARTRQSGDDVPSITGDVVVESVTVNDKGGSLSAIIKRKIRGRLRAAERCYGAKLEFEPGVSCVLVAGRQKRVRVSKISRGFIVELVDGDQEVVDPTTKAVLDIYEEMLKAGKVKLLSADGALVRLDGVRERAGKLLAGTTKSRREPPSPK